MLVSWVLGCVHSNKRSSFRVASCIMIVALDGSTSIGRALARISGSYEEERSDYIRAQ